jgi:hypothetical protein
MPTQMHQRQALLVVGMHRSGTSALGGVLAALGAQAPKTLMPPTKDNPRGYWESMVLTRFNDEVLASAGSAWHDWGRFAPEWIESAVADDFVARLPSLIEEEFDGAGLFMLKDPRVCRLLPLWLRVLTDMRIEAKAILPIRHPLEVMRSLETRDTFVSSRSLLIWLRHVLDAELGSRSIDRAVVRYADVLRDWRTQMRRLAVNLHISWPKWSPDTEVAIDHYLSTGLRHHVEAKDGPIGHAQIADWVEACFDAVCQLVENSADAQALAVLDQVRAEFDASSEVFAAVARESEQRAAWEARQREQQVASFSERLKASEEGKNELERQHAAEVQKHVAAAAELQQRAAEQEEALSTRLQEAERRATEIVARHASELSQLQAHAKKLEAQVSEMRSAIQARERALDELGAKHREAEQAWRETAAGKDVQIAARFAEIASLTRMLADSEHGLARLQAEQRALARSAQQQKAKIASLDKELAGTRTGLVERIGEIQVLQARVAAAESALASLRRSRSWRLTSPLRRLAQAISRSRHAKDGDLALIRATELFDSHWYLTANPDVAVAGIDPAEHYLAHGAAEGRDPGPHFISRRYLEAYPDVAASGMNPLVHYLRHGRAEGRAMSGPALIRTVSLATASSSETVPHA